MYVWDWYSGSMSHPVPSILKRWKQLQSGMDLSAEAFDSLSKRLKTHTKRWLKADQHAQLNRNADPSLMDLYDTATSKGMHIIIIEWIQCLCTMNVSSSLCCRNPAESYFGGKQRCFFKWSSILDCIRYQDTRTAVCAWAHSNVCMLTSYSDWLSGISFDTMEPSSLQKKLKSLRTSKVACKSSLTSFNTKQIHLSFISMAWTIREYYLWICLLYTSRCV